jgi:hypothetical protein
MIDLEAAFGRAAFAVVLAAYGGFLIAHCAARLALPLRGDGKRVRPTGSERP